MQMANPKANALGFKLVSEVSFLYPFLGRILLYLVCESKMQMAQFSKVVFGKVHTEAYQR